MTKAQRLEHGKRIKRGWAKRKAKQLDLSGQIRGGYVKFDPIDQWPDGTFATATKAEAEAPRKKLSDLIRQEVARALDELLS